MTKEERENHDDLVRAYDELMKGYCGLSIGYMAGRLLELERTQERQAARLRELTVANEKLNQRLDKASHEFNSLEKKVKRNGSD